MSPDSAVATAATTRVSSLIRLPIITAQSVELRYALLQARDRFNPTSWNTIPLHATASDSSYFELDLNQQNLSDGVYEYEFVINGDAHHPVADPYADEITRFGGYRGIFRITNRQRTALPFSWEDELPATVSLPNNNEIIIYEMPIRWMNIPAGETGTIRQIGLGTFDRVIFERLDQLTELGINTIELLPVQDSADTLNWGYGSRFFFTPDIDMGGPVDLKLFIKRCHQRGIRVFMDVVMNHARECPLEALADEWFFLKNGSEEPGRGNDYGARLFRYVKPGPNGVHFAREFHYQMAEYWIREYHIDGFRIDEFKGINHWEFIQTFAEKARSVFNQCLPNRPFLVIAEDSSRSIAIVKDQATHPNNRKIVDAMWNFAFRDEIRRLSRNAINTQWGEPSRRERIQALITGWQTWEEWEKNFRPGFQDMAQTVNYITSHDVEKVEEQRFFNYTFGQVLRERQLSDGNVHAIRHFVDNLGTQSFEIQQAHYTALDRVRSAFGLLLTAVGIPMFLAGEEFADCHDLDHTDWRLKMSDPIDWRRRDQAGHKALYKGVSELIQLRKTHSALHRNEIVFFYFHPDIDQNDGVRVFAYCRTDNKPLGSKGQVVTVANAGPHDFPVFDVDWPWTDTQTLQEIAAPEMGTFSQFHTYERRATFSLAPFQTRVFRT